jgi:hypothetical protein
MKATLKYTGLLLFYLWTCSSCLTVYAPSAVNTPLLQEKGEFKASIANNNLQVSTAVTDHVGVMVNGYLNAHTSEDKTFRNNGKGAELGIGYFAHTENRITYEAYGGAGLYNVRIREANDSKTFDVDATKYFVQPSVGWVNQYFEVVLSPRLSVIKYGSPEIKGYSTQEKVNNYFDTINQKAHAFMEPTLTVRGGYRFVKLQLQIGHSYKLSKGPINNDTGIGSVGLIFDIGKWYQTAR